jgi:uncharacterized membrane protein
MIEKKAIPVAATANAAAGATGRRSFNPIVAIGPPAREAGRRAQGAYSRAMTRHQPIGRRIAPPRFLVFAGVALVAIPAAVAASDWAAGLMLGFDAAAATFLAGCAHLLRTESPATMRKAAPDNDANRAVLLGIAALVSFAVLAAVAVVLDKPGAESRFALALVLTTLALAWLFANTVYALHYAHLFYLPDAHGKDSGGIDFPGPGEPDYADFAYFAFTLGMTFQTSDVVIRSRRIRRIATLHSLLAFVFNLGIIAFTINVLGG